MVRKVGEEGGRTERRKTGEAKRGGREGGREGREGGREGGEREGGRREGGREERGREGRVKIRKRACNGRVKEVKEERRT